MPETDKMKTEIKNLIMYGMVGGMATVVEWTCFYVLNGICSMQYMLATAVAFIFSTFANWFFGRIIMFKKSEKSLFKELVQIYITSVGGLVLNLVIMYVLVDFFSVNEMVSKMLATAMVFIYNYTVRKKLIYKG